LDHTDARQDLVIAGDSIDRQTVVVGDDVRALAVSGDRLHALQLGRAGKDLRLGRVE
jgi:hypothetical protein